jgi:aminoglycoside 2''-phosphotransferase
MTQVNQSADTAAVILPAYTIDAGSAPHVATVRWLGAGDYCSCYLVNEHMVFRFANHAAASAAMRVETCLLPLLHEQLHVAVPAPAFTGRRDDTGAALMGYPLLPGTPLEPGVLEALPTATQERLLAQLAASLRRLHTLPLPALRACGVPVRDPLPHLTEIIARARVTLWPRLKAPVWQYYEALVEEYARAPQLQRYQPALLHGDLSPDHVLADLDQGRLTGLIDFGDAWIGDPAWDLIYLLEDHGLPLLQRFLTHYAPQDQQLLAHKVQIYQQVNNVDYCLALLEADEGDALAAGLALLDAQAQAGSGERTARGKGRSHLDADQHSS